MDHAAKSYPAARWRRHRLLRWGLPLILLLVVLTYFGGPRLSDLLGRGPHPEAGRFMEVASDPVRLIDRFRSYDRLETVLRALKEADYAPAPPVSRQYPKSSRYPPNDFDTLYVEAYEHLGVQGRLGLFFFNDRLFQAEFQPSDPEAYARGLRKLGLRPRADENARAEVVKGDLRIVSTVVLAVSAVGRQMRTEPWILWQDLRLIRQRDEWDARFGSIPKPAGGS